MTNAFFDWLVPKTIVALGQVSSASDRATTDTEAEEVALTNFDHEREESAPAFLSSRWQYHSFEQPSEAAGS